MPDWTKMVKTTVPKFVRSDGWPDKTTKPGLEKMIQSNGKVASNNRPQPRWNPGMS